MPRGRSTRKALLVGAFFVAGWLLPAIPALAACTLERIDESATADYAYDGDTLRLTDGRRLRFIGLDTPEIGRDGRPSQPYARAARERLLELVNSQDGRLRLQLGRERQDRYGRLLAHPALPDGTNLTETLLREGLATHLVVPPNTALANCYAAAEAQARRAGRGIWSLPAYAARPTIDLPPKAEGFHILRGTVERIGRGRHTLWLNLDGRVAVKIGEEHLAYFGDMDWDALTGRRIEIRGWLHPRRDGSRMLTLRHPAALTVLTDANS
ncbi:MAG TPA: thermonuclease family protein [Thioalkalivibrio sp.]|nr:thermonuclease family protein [Thioalkalivibrio sp.]